jgi:mannose/fructose/N-acetylgalactosamine-specific phosphotransferase system component IIB
MTLLMMRIDDRLIHGQVGAMWTRRLGANRIVIANDATVKDPFLSKVMKMTAPLGVKVDIFGLDDALKAMASNQYDKDKLFLLCKTPEDVLALLEGGLKVDKLNIGGMGSKPGTVQLYKNISVLPTQVETIRKIIARGVKIEIQILPDSEVVDASTLALVAGK